MKISGRISIIIVLLFLSLSNIHAAAGNLELSVTGASNNTDVLNPAEYAVDDSILTYWMLYPEETEGWFEITLNELSCIYAIELSGTLDLENIINFEYDSNGIWKSFLNHELTAISSSGEYIDVSAYKIVTDKIRVYLQGEDTSYSNIEDLKVFGESFSDTYHKFNIKNISGEENIFHPLSNLSDENTKTYWETESIGNWVINLLRGARNWITECFENGNFNFRNQDTMWKNENGAVISLQSSSKIYRIKAYLSEDYTGDARINYLADGEWTEITVIEEENITPGWHIIDIPYGLEADSIQLISDKTSSTGSWWSWLFGSDSSEISGLCEIEFWGKSYSPVTEALAFFIEDTDLNSGLNGIFDASISDNYKVEFILNVNSGNCIIAEINGNQIQVPLLKETDGAFFYQVKIDNDLLWNGDNFLRLESLDNHLIRGSISGISRTGILNNIGVPDYFTADSTGYYEIDLNSEISLEEVLLTTNNIFNERIFYRSENQWFELTWSALTSHTLKYSVYLSESGNNVNLSADCIRIEGLTSGTQYGVTVKGSRITDSAPQIQMYWPKNGEVIEQSKLGTMFAVGYVDDENAVISLNDEEAQNIGNLFWIANMPGNIITDGEYALHISATDLEGRTTEKTIYWSNIDSNVYSCDLSEEIIYTLDDTIKVEGRTNPSASVYINEEIVDGSSRLYSKDVELIPGLNIITIKFVHRTQGIFALLQRRVFLVTTEPVLEISKPDDIDYTSAQQIDLTGILSVAGAYEIECEDYEVQDDGTLFTVASVSLVSGVNNNIIVTLTDQFGRTSTDSVSVFCDVNTPVLTGLSPERGSILSESVNTFVITVSDESELSVFMNGLVVPGGSGIFEKTISLSDGFYSLPLVLKDQAGNTRQDYLDYTVDTVPPVDFTVDVTPAGWTSDNHPVISFKTTDATSGIDYYEISIDEGSYYVIKSPYQLPVQDEGEHTIAVRAVDKAGHMTYSYAETKTDTILPEALTTFDIIPGNAELNLYWSDGESDVISYEIIRSPQWDDGEQLCISRREDNQVFTDTEVLNGFEYSYKVRAVDRAENKSGFTATINAVPGIETQVIPDSGKVKAEYETSVLFINTESLPPDAQSIRIAELAPDWIEAEALNFEHTFVGSVYDFTLLDSNDEETSPGILFSESYIGVLDYDPSLLPSGYSEENISVYSFDKRWGRWSKLKNCAVDPENNKVVFSSNHFSLYTPVADSVEDISPEEIADSGYSPFGTYVNHEGFTVSPQGGNAHTSVTELVLSGPNGFDFELKRYYDLSVAKSDTHADVPVDVVKYLENQGDYAYSMGNGWRLNLPYIKNASAQQYLIMPDGSMFGFKSLQLTNTPAKSDKRSLILESHSGEHFSLLVTQTENDKEVYFIGAGGSSEQSWISTSYTLTLTDGKQYIFDGKGRTTEIKSSDEEFSISVSYASGSYEIDKISDSVGRYLSFEYAETSDSIDMPYIKKISLDSADPYRRSISYTQENGYLISSIDTGGRNWSYGYGNEYYVGGPKNPVPFSLTEALKEFNDDTDLYDIISNLAEPVSEYTYKPLSTIEGPGMGRIEATYDTVHPSDDENAYCRVLTKQVTVYNDYAAGSDDSVRATMYDYDFTDADSDYGYYISKSIVDELNHNRYIAYNYEFKKLTKTYWSEEDGIITSETIEDDENSGSRFNNEKWYEKINNSSSNLKLLKTKTKSYAEETDVNPSSEKITHGLGNDSITTNYTYDDWGNRTVIEETSVAGSRVRKNITYRDYSSGESASGASYKEYSESGLINENVPARIKNLVIKEQVTNYTPLIDSLGTGGNNAGTAVKAYNYYSYDDKGRLNGKSVWDSSNNVWNKTLYTWNSAGDLSSITDSENHVTSFTYDANHYILTKTEKAVTDADGNPTDIKWQYKYNYAGWLISETDPRQKTTTTAFDKLGRVVSKTEPGDAGDNYIINVFYNDIPGLLYSTMTDSLGRKIVREYNDLSQMVKQSSYLDSATASVIELGYDRFGKVTKMINPNAGMTDAGDIHEYVTWYRYNALGRLSEISYPYRTSTGAVSKTMDYNYDTNTLTITDEENNQSTEIYDMRGNVIKKSQVVDDETIITEFWYDGLGNLIAQEGPYPDAVITKKYNSLNQLVKLSMPLNTFYEGGSIDTSIAIRPVTEYFYDSKGNNVKETRMSSEGIRIIKKQYDELGRIIKIKNFLDDEQLNEEFIYYDENGNVTRKIDPNGCETSYTYTPGNNVETETDAEHGVTSYEYYDDGLVKSAVDPRGNSGNYPSLDFKVTYEYDKLKRLSRVELPPKNDGGARTSVYFEYDLRGNLVKQTDVDGLVTEYKYTPRQWVEQKSITGDGKSYITSNEYNRRGKLKKITDPRNQSTNMDYDELGRLIYSRTSENTINRFDYDEAGNIIEKKWYGRDGINVIQISQKFEYDPYQRLIKQFAPVKSEETSVIIEKAYGYDRFGNMSFETDALGNSIIYSYDSLNRLVREESDAGFLKEFDYDYGGRLIENVDSNGNRSIYLYDDRGLLLSRNITGPNGEKSVTFAYDEAGEVKWSSDDDVFTGYNGAVSTSPESYLPDVYGRINSVETSMDGKSFNTFYEYNPSDLVTGITSPDGGRVGYNYNLLGELQSIEGYIDSAPVYDAVGLIKSITASNGVCLSLEYDGESRLTSRIFSGQEAEYVKKYSLDYDEAGNISDLIKNDSAFASTYNYDLNNRLLSDYLREDFAVNPENTSNQETLYIEADDVNGQNILVETKGTEIFLDYAAGSIGVDLNGNYKVARIELTSKDKTRVKAENLRVFVSDDNTENSYAEQKDFTVNDAETGGFEITLKKLVKTRYIKVMTDFNERDIDYTPLRTLSEFKGSPEDILKIYHYVSLRNETYSYDDAGNRTSLDVSYTGNSTDFGTISNTYLYYPKTNRLITDGNYSFQYDANGNMTAKGKSLIVDSIVVSVSAMTDWSSFSDSTSGITFSDSDELWNYSYDVLNRLIRVSKNGTIVASYTYNADGLRVKKEKEERTDYYVFDLNGNVLYEEKFNSTWSKYIYIKTTKFAREDGIVGEAMSKKYYYHTDHLGSTVMITDEEADVIWDCEYTPFGELNNKQNFAEQKTQFTGKDFDPDTGLYYYNARWYDPNLGRFTTEDPIRDGLNWYIYANNNPLKFVDPTGLAPRNLSYEERKAYIDSIKSWTNNNLAKNYSDYQCAGLTTVVANEAMKASTGNSEYFKELTHNGNNLTDLKGSQPIAADFAPNTSDAKNNISYYKDGSGNNYTDIKQAFEDGIIEPGTIGVFGSNSPDEYSGHVFTVQNIREEDGVITMDIIEGHSAEGRSSEISKNITIDNFQEYIDNTGEFYGFGEIGVGSALEQPPEGP